MSFSVNTNYQANTAIRLLDRTTRGLSIAQAHLNSGFRVGGAKDNGSTFAIAQGMRGDVGAFRSINAALTLGKATVNVAVAAARRISDTLNEMKAKITA